MEGDGIPGRSGGLLSQRHAIPPVPLVVEDADSFGPFDLLLKDAVRPVSGKIVNHV